MAIEIDKLNVGLPDQIEFQLTNKIVNAKTSIRVDRWSDMSDEEREAFIMEWATKRLLDAATVTSRIAYASKATNVQYRPIKDNPQA